MDHEFKVVKLHDFPDLIEQAALLLNSEWPRSLTARCHSLSNSSDDLPCSLLLLQVSNGNVPKVVGYSYLSKVLQKPKSVLIESVVVDTVLRGRGLGRMIMEKTEDLAQKIGYETIYLSTHDKYTFYKYLGYNNSIAISPVRKVSKFLSEALIGKHDDDNYHEISTKTPVLTDSVLEQADEKRVGKTINHLQQDATTFQSPPPPPFLPPPPPPLPQIPSFQSRTPHESALGASTERKRDNIGEHKRIIWMKKYLCHSLSNSSDDLPCSLLLLQVSNGNVPKVVGYSYLSKVLQKPKSVLIESVVVDTVLRGRGLGRMIMEKTEDLAQKIGYETIYLSTHDKYTFYKYLGYNNSIAISPVRKVSKFLSEALIGKHDDDNYHEISTKTPVLTDSVLEQADEKRVGKTINHLQQDATTFQSPPPPPFLPPPPPPLPQIPSFQSRTPHESALGASTERKRDNIGEHKRIIWMKKYL